MEIRWAATATTGDLAHPRIIQGAISSRSLASGASVMPSRCLCVCSSQMAAATSSSSLFSSEDVPTWTNSLSGAKRLRFASPRNENVAAGERLSRIGNRVLVHHGLRCGDFSSSRGNEVFILKMVQALSIGKGKGRGRGYDQTQRTKASSDASSSQPTTPASSSSSSSSTTTTTTTTPKKQPNGFLSPILSIPRSIWRQLVLPLSNFGFGKTSIWEGGVGLFVISGTVLLALTLTWVKGTQIRSRSRKYEAVIEFARAQGITVGTPVRIRGVGVGSVVGMRPSLERIDVVVQLEDVGIVIPRNALVEVNQSGLISETLIDVTPRDPLPRPTVGPLDKRCSEEGLIVCDRERIKGEQGVSLDELVLVCTKIARQMGDIGVVDIYGLAERVAAAIDEAKPLLGKVEILAEDIEPLLKDLKGGVLLKDLERLTKVVAETGDDLRTLNKSVLTTENIELLRQSVATLTKTLSHIESISQDVSGVTGDAGTKKNLRQLIESLSRLIMD